jgi:hypothetical protein
MDLGHPGNRTSGIAYEDPVEAFRDFFPIDEFFKQGIPAMIEAGVKDNAKRNAYITDGKSMLCLILLASARLYKIKIHNIKIYIFLCL